MRVARQLFAESFFSRGHWAATLLVAVSFALATGDVLHAQRGFRIGNLQISPGQGVRVGNSRVGVLFGGGQGAQVATRDFNVRLGGGQPDFGRGNAGPAVGGYPVSGPVGAIPDRLRMPNVTKVPPGQFDPMLSTLSDAEPAGSIPESRNAPGEISIEMPSGASGPMPYRLNGNTMSLSPGNRVTLDASTRWTVQYFSGPGLGYRVTQLKPTTRYRFEHLDELGWRLQTVAQRPAPEIETSASVAAPTEAPAEADREPVTQQPQRASNPQSRIVSRPILETEPSVQPEPQPASPNPAPATQAERREQAGISILEWK